MATEVDVRTSLCTLLAALGRGGEPDEQVVTTWTRALRGVEPKKLLIATDALSQRVVRMPSISEMLKAVADVREPTRVGPCCPDCQYGIRTGFYRLTQDDLDEAGHFIQRVQRHAEVALACDCEGGGRYLEILGRWDKWKAWREAQAVQGTTDVVWVSDRAHLMVPWEVLHPGQQRPPPMPATSSFNPRRLVGRGEETPRVPRDWNEPMVDDRDEEATA